MTGMMMAAPMLLENPGFVREPDLDRLALR
jgi:hypothetical protein